MLGYVLVRQPTAILRQNKVNAWTCAWQTTDRDLETKKVNAWICAWQTTDRDIETKKVNAWICTPPTTDRDPANVIFL